MKSINGLLSIIITAALAALSAVSCSDPHDKQVVIGSKGEDIELKTFKNDSGGWAVAVEGAGLASVRQDGPVKIELFDAKSGPRTYQHSYDHIIKTRQGFRGFAKIRISGSAAIGVQDEWELIGKCLKLRRQAVVSGSSDGGFMSGITLVTLADVARSDAAYFAPGMIYGSTDNCSPNAIGGKDTYTSGNGQVWIREDRLPAPLLGIYFADGSSISVLDPSPDTATTSQDSHDFDIVPMIDERFRFGSVGAGLRDTKQECGFWLPGTEGEITYLGNTYPGGQVKKWRRRYHPLKEGFKQCYDVEFRFCFDTDFPDYYANAWRWAWQTLKPQVTVHDINQVCDSITDMLAGQVQYVDSRAGITNFVTAAANETPQPHPNAIMGFTGKNIEAAYCLLQDSYRQNNPRSEAHRKLGIDIIETFTKLKMNPPAGEGFVMASGEPALAIPANKVVYLRSFGDDMKIAVRAYLLEKRHGIEHPSWRQWLVGFGDWLLTQQGPEGQFPRTWHPGTGQVADPSPQCTYNAIPFLVLLSEVTDSDKYFKAAVKAADYCWRHGGSSGIFVGGTIDNPNVIDKEAGTLSLEAYLTLYHATKDAKWLEYAKRAANFAETWIYIHHVPMPQDEDNSKLHWKKGVSTIGLQLISSGHSLVDDYMAFDADEYARMYLYTGDPHYFDVAGILLHNTKSMIALPARPYDLRGSGWQQEHFSLAPPRGYGLHRGWLPWVATSQLNGIFGIYDLDDEQVSADLIAKNGNSQTKVKNYSRRAKQK
jgi:hypothetical protein